MTLKWMCSAAFVCLLSQAYASFSDLKLAHCPPRYKIWGSEESELEIEMKDGSKECRLIKKSRKVENYVPTTPVLDPQILLGKRSKEVLNITWIWTADENKKLPKSYLLQFQKVHENQYSTSCILLRLRKKKKVKNKNTLTFFFDCIELVPEDKTYLIVQIWRLSDQHTKKNAIHRHTGPTRHKRSVPVSKTCRNILGDIQCSVEEMAHLSLDPYVPSICHCSKRPTVHIERLLNGSLQVTVWNLPQYAFNIDVRIEDKDRGHMIVYATNMTGTKQANESRIMATNRILGPGHYIAVVHAECPGDQKDLLAIGSDCPLMDRKKSNITVEVPYPVAHEDSDFRLHFPVLAGILAAVAFTGALTVIVFCMVKCRRGRKIPGNGQEIEMVPLNSTLQTSRIISTLTGTTQTSHSPLSDQTESGKLQENYFAAASGRIKVEARSTQVNHIAAYKNSKTETNLTSDTPCTPKTELSLLRLAKRKSKKMLLCHPDNPCHEDAVMELRNILHDSFDIDLPTDATINWRDFAESAGKAFTELVIILSPRLIQLCRVYEDKTLDRRDFERLHEKRSYEYIPCVAMKKLQTLIHENPHNCQFSLHFVCFGSDSWLVEDFLHVYDFLRRGSNYFTYNLCVHEIASGANRWMVHLHKENLKKLILRLKGISEQEPQCSVIDLIVSEEDFGQALLQKLLRSC